MAVLLPNMSTSLSLPLSHMTNAHSEPGKSGSPVADSDAGLMSLPVPKKPKLSLQTTSLGNTYGSLTRGLAADQQSIYTPTTGNTLSNTWDLSYRPSPVVNIESPKPLQISRLQPQAQQEGQPYSLTLPFGVRSILKNSPLQKCASAVSASPRDSKRKLFFPQPKRVNFRRDLEDVIYTTRYVAKHSDLSSSEDESPGEEAPIIETPQEYTSSQISPPPTRKRKDRRDSGVSIDATNIEENSPRISNNLGAESLKTCKRRRWQWSVPTAHDHSAVEQPVQELRDECSSDTHDEEDTPYEPVSTHAEIQRVIEGEESGTTSSNFDTVEVHDGPDDR